MSVPIVGKLIDERFLNRRLRSTSFAGIVAGVVAIGLWMYRYYFDHVWSWDLFAVAVIFVVVKLAIMTWFRLTD